MSTRYRYCYCTKGKTMIGLPTHNGGYEARIVFPDRESAKKGWEIARQADHGRTRKEYIKNVLEAVKSVGGERVKNLVERV